MLVSFVSTDRGCANSRLCVLQAVSSWSAEACCAVSSNVCYRKHEPPEYPDDTWCKDYAPASDWLFKLWPGSPQRFDPINTAHVENQHTGPWWPRWGNGGGLLEYGPDLWIGSRVPGAGGACAQGHTYGGTAHEICGGGNWGSTDVEVWYPR